MLKNARAFAGIFLFVFLFLGSISACVAPQSKQLTLEQPNDLPSKAYINNVPFYPQKQFHCGPSTLAMAMNFYGQSLSPQELAKDVFTPGRKGSFQSEMKAAVRKRGMLAYELTPELVFLLAEVSVGHPVIILQNKSIKYYPIWHYALVIGYDLNKKQIYLHSGENKNYAVSISVFEFTWKRSNHWAMAVLPTDTLPNDRNLINALQAAVDLEEVGQIESANQTYQTITKRWPESLVAIMGAANSHLSLGNATEATNFYLRALKLNPQRADIYNNLAYSLLAQSCYQPSLNSIQCAISLDANNPEFIDSQQEISQSANKTTSKTCPKILCTPP
ncbi:MAG: PA2778 family cysteine peptidase [Gammaproteobacteria bacterium]